MVTDALDGIEEEDKSVKERLIRHSIATAFGGDFPLSYSTTAL